MSPKSRRKFNKYAGQRRNPPSTATRSQVATPTAEIKAKTVTNIRQTEPRVSAATAIASYENVPRELKTIGILAGISLVVLIIVAIIIT